MESSDKQNDNKRPVTQVADNATEPLTKRQKRMNELPAKNVLSKIIEAMRNKDASQAYELYKQYITLAKKIDASLYSILFGSLATKEDETFLTLWIHDMEERNIPLTENMFTLIIQYYASLKDIDMSCLYLNMIVEHGLSIRYRNYLPILQVLSENGNVALVDGLLVHMKEHEIPWTENAYYYKLKTCLSANDESLFLHTFSSMMETIEIIQEKPFIDLLTEFTSKYPHWKLQKCSILSNGNCSTCGQSLKRMPLPLIDKHSIAYELEEVILHSARKYEEQRVQNFNDFKQFLRTNGPFDIFLDGANIAHYKQNFDGGCFDYTQIQMIAEYLQSHGKRILIVLHEHHFGQKHTDLPEKWLEQKIAYKVIKGNNDDWYWMYAALAADNDAMILSNDQMRDHFFKIQNDSRFQKWREHNQINYDIWSDAKKKKFLLRYPKPYTQRIQQNEYGFHIPFGKIEENMKYIETDYCLVDTNKTEGTILSKIVSAIDDTCVIQ